MQPLARLSHSVAVLEPEETVRGSSRSVVLPNSLKTMLVGVLCASGAWVGEVRRAWLGEGSRWWWTDRLG